MTNIFASSLCVLLPVIVLSVGALIALAVEPFLENENKHKALPWVATVFLFLSAVSLYVTPEGSYYQVYAMDSMRKVFSLAILFSAFLGIGGLQWTLVREKFPGGEAYGLLMLASVGAILMSLSTDFLALFIGMELAAFPVYALVGIRRKDALGNEGAFKYFVSGAIFSAIFLYGVSFVYGATGSTGFGAACLSGRATLLLIGLLLVFIGLFFKAGAAPMHFWVADVYTGAPVSVTAFMAAVVKVGALAGIVSVWTSFDIDRSLKIVFALVALLSMIIGAFSGLAQKSVRRILAFSAVMNAGFMLLALFLHKTNSEEFFGGVLQFFLVTYAIASAGALTGIAYLAGKEDERETLPELNGLGRKSPILGAGIVICLASLAGLPPVAGFLAKFDLFVGLFREGYAALASAAFFLSIIAAVYYLRIAYALFFKSGESFTEKIGCECASSSILLKAGVALSALVVIVLSIFPDWVCF